MKHLRLFFEKYLCKCHNHHQDKHHFSRSLGNNNDNRIINSICCNKNPYLSYALLPFVFGITGSSFFKLWRKYYQQSPPGEKEGGAK